MRLRGHLEKRQWQGEPVLALQLPLAIDSQGDGQPYRYTEQPERLGGAVEQLSFANGRCGVFELPGTVEKPPKHLDFFFLEYDPGNPRFIHDVFGHAPEACMRSTGAELKEQHPSRHISLGDRSMEVRVLEFRSPISSDPLWVFQFTWLPPDTPFDPYETAYTMREHKFAFALLGRPKPPARVLLAGALGYDSLEEAWSSYEELLVSRLRLE